MKFLKFWIAFMVISFVGLAIAVWLHSGLETNDLHPSYSWGLGYVSGVIAFLGGYIFSEQHKKP